MMSCSLTKESGEEEVYLNFGEIDELQHVDVSFDVAIYLQQGLSGDPKCGIELSLQVELFLVDDEQDEEKRLAPDGAFEIFDDLKIRKDTGRCEIKVKVKKCDSMVMENKQLVLRARSGSDVQEAWSNPFKVFRHRLVVEATDWNEIWYKDVGGKENILSVPVALVDASNQIITNRKVKLAISCVYDGTMLPVPDQSLLKIFMSDTENNDHKKLIVLHGGRALIRFRIEEVSKNHQNKAFRLKIAPDTRNSPADFDVSTTFTKAISVRSKINRKRQRGEDDFVSTTTPALNILSTAAINNTISCQAAIQTITQLQQIASSKNKNTLDSQKALTDLTAWTLFTLRGLATIEWKHLGNEPRFDGSPDPNRPYYIMTNPNDQIAEILSQFNTLVAPHCRDTTTTTTTTTTTKSTTKRKKLDTIVTQPCLEARKSLKDLMAVTGTNHLADLSAPARRFSEFSDDVADIPSDTKVPPRMPSRQYQISNNYLIPPTIPKSTKHDLNEHLASDFNERAVRLVLAKRFIPPSNPTNSSLGFPAFDANSRLIGFYREETNQSSTQIVFLPANHQTAALKPHDWIHATHAYEHEVQAKSDCVFDVSNFDNLTRLKEEVAIYYWSKEPFLDSAGTAVHLDDENNVITMQHTA